MRKTLFVLVSLAAVFLPFRSWAQDLIKPGQTLTIEQCVSIALSKNPGIMAASETVNAAASRVGEARSAYLPQVDISSDITKSSVSGGGALARGGGGSGFSGSADVNQNIYDFGRTSSQVALQKYSMNASRQDFQDTAQVLAFQVRQAYYRVLQAMHNRDVAAEVVKQNKLHLEQAVAFHNAGVKPQYDVTTAEVNLSNAKLSLITAQDAILVAKAQLNTLMGVPQAPDYNLEDNFAFQPYNINLDEAMKRAMENRPDLKSFVFRESAARSALSFASKGNLPFITGIAQYGWAGDLTPIQDGWSIGAGISIPVFNGFLTRYQTHEAQASLNVAEANKNGVAQGIYLDIQQTYVSLVDAAQRTQTASLAVKQAQENLDIANGRYKYGVGSPIEVTDALATYATSNTSYINALYDYKVAVANMERAMGTMGGINK